MKPTLKQVQFLTSRGITMPRSKTLAFKLISFLKHGYHPDSLTDESSRIAFVKSTQAKWLDQRIMHSCGPGQVISISARTIEEHAEWTDMQQQPVHEPVLLLVRLDEKRRGRVFLASPCLLTLVAEPVPA
ncbi:MAG: hypothetical protein A2722_02100 [Candidatus Doudnabacteria bacterium RIFCSPHIGHO2_01_FULL_50_11]|uniref:Uncharacterized protein n=1 Tax=Candidatus Doudnabacteria bacterium RIFCSPHIGHO2_01_FULL_50_11 TaxID=1817828 RepID=A0A1F5PIJ6_9BACT|nr:MAG: hypothetical protein A2722_02100 [Candidatus Doudnabacteria bacterium RIFCSPHIGHO2_01_FULL_50_11]